MDLQTGPGPLPADDRLDAVPPDAAPAPDGGGPPRVIWLLAVAMAVVAGLLATPTLLDDPSAAVPDLEWLALLPLFALAEVVVIHLPTQRNAHGHTWREIPAVLGLTFLAPQQYVSAYVVGAGLALLVAARMRGLKLAFNLAMFALEATLGALVYHAVIQGGDPVSPVGWLAVLVAVLVTDLISAAAVTAAISLTEGVFDGEVLHEALVSGSVAAFLNTCVALVVATLLLVRPSAVVLLAPVVVLLVVGYRSYVALARDGLAARLGAGGLVTHVLVVCDRSFSKESFEPEDVQVFETLAAHAGVALERTRTVADLQALATELEEARDAALAASRAKSLFLANMSHEIRTPLTVMLAGAEMLEDTDLDDDQRSLLERTHRAGGSLKALVEGILDFSRLESGIVEVATKPVDLRALVDDVASVYGPRADRAGVRFEAEVDPRVPARVVSDPGRLFQVLANLVDNAVKFTPAGPEGRVHLQVAPDPDGERLRLTVRDSGIGIAPEHRATIFDVFSQVDPSTTRHYDGTGLGLAICRQLVDLLGGTLEVESALGGGSTFTVRLPSA